MTYYKINNNLTLNITTKYQNKNNQFKKITNLCRIFMLKWKN